METFWEDALAIACVALGAAACFLNIRYAFKAAPEYIRAYLAAKGLVAGLVAVLYIAAFFHMVDPAAVPNPGRVSLLLLLFLMLCDVVVRDPHRGDE